MTKTADTQAVCSADERAIRAWRRLSDICAKRLRELREGRR